jgi:hypothetical protein
MCLHVNGSSHGLSDQSHTCLLLRINSIQVQYFSVHSITPVPLSKIKALYICDPNSNVANANPKLKLQNGAQTKFSCLKCTEKYGVSTGTKILNLKCTKILNQEIFNQGSNVLFYSQSHTVKLRLRQTVLGKGLLCIPHYKHTLCT